MIPPFYGFSSLVTHRKKVENHRLGFNQAGKPDPSWVAVPLKGLPVSLCKILFKRQKPFCSRIAEVWQILAEMFIKEVGIITKFLLLLFISGKNEFIIKDLIKGILFSAGMSTNFCSNPSWKRQATDFSLSFQTFIT